MFGDEKIRVGPVERLVDFRCPRTELERAELLGGTKERGGLGPFAVVGRKPDTNEDDRNVFRSCFRDGGIDVLENAVRLHEGWIALAGELPFFINNLVDEVDEDEC